MPRTTCARVARGATNAEACPRVRAHFTKAATMPQQPGPPELVPVQLTLGTSQGTLQDWLLWPLATTPHEVESFAEALCRDLAVPPQFRRPVAETIAAQVKGWVENVPPPAPGLGPRRELVRCGARHGRAAAAARRRQSAAA